MKSYFLGILLLLSCTSPETNNDNYVRFNHVMLYVSDLDRSIEFYSQAFPVTVRDRISKLTVSTGDESVERDVSMATLQFGDQDFVLEISEQVLPDSVVGQSHFQHLGINVLNIDEIYDRMIAAGAEAVSPVRVVRANAIVAKNTFLRGPDGELIELMQVLEGDF